MEFLELSQQLFNTLLVPLLAVITVFLIRWINVQAEELKKKTDNEIAQKYIDLLNYTISTCVTATNQTYVDALKDKNAFTKEAQEEAFRRTFEAVQEILSDEAKKYLEEVYNDLNEYIVNQIEATVNFEKQ
jgi:acyl-CoA synthetase (AMP-forming)/AMP-acid ligase II